MNSERTVDLFDLESALTDLDVKEQVSVSNDAITNMVSNFVLKEVIICDN